MVELGTLIFILLILTGFGLLHLLAQKMRIPRSWLWLVWTAKIGYTFLYVYIFTTFYGEGDRIQGDARHFMQDSEVLHTITVSDPGTYIQLIAGFKGDDPELLNGPLAATNIWDYGDNGDWINDNRLMIRLNSLLHFISAGNVYVHILFFSMLAFLGILLLFKAFEEHVQQKRFFFFALGLVPSIAFFGSGLTKETILIFSIGLLFWTTMKLLKGSFRIPLLAGFLLATALCLFNKPYTGLVAIPFVLMLFVSRAASWKGAVLFVTALGVVLLGVLLSYLPDKINLVEKISYKQKDVMNLARGGVFFVNDTAFCAVDYVHFEHFDTVGNNQIRVNTATPGEYKLFGQKTFHPLVIPPSEKTYSIYLVSQPSTSYFETTAIGYQGINLLKTIPECLLNTLIRPFPNDPGSILKYVTLLQNWSLLVLGIFAFVRHKCCTPLERTWVVYLLMASLILLLVIGWTTPVFGAIVRYKVPVDLFMLISFFILYSPTKIKST